MIYKRGKTISASPELTRKELILALNRIKNTKLCPVISVKCSHSEHITYAYNYVKWFTIDLRGKKASARLHVSVNYSFQFLHKT